MQEIGSLLCVISLSVQCFFFRNMVSFFINKVYSLGHTRKGKIPKTKEATIYNKPKCYKRKEKYTHRGNTATNVIMFIHFNSNLKAQMRIVHLSFWREKC